MVLEVTAKDKTGKELGKFAKHYHTQATTGRDEKMMYGAQWKASYMRDTSLQPFQTKAETFEFDLPDGVRSAEVSVTLTYEISKPENSVTIHAITRNVSLDR